MSLPFQRTSAWRRIHKRVEVAAIRAGGAWPAQVSLAIMGTCSASVEIEEFEAIERRMQAADKLAARISDRAISLAKGALLAAEAVRFGLVSEDDGERWAHIGEGDVGQMPAIPAEVLQDRNEFDPIAGVEPGRSRRAELIAEFNELAPRAKALAELIRRECPEANLARTQCYHEAVAGTISATHDYLFRNPCLRGLIADMEADLRAADVVDCPRKA